MAWNLPSLSRRAFLKTTGYGGAGLTLLSRVGRLAGGTADEADGEQTSYSICNFCSSLCNIEVTTRSRHGERRIVKLDGNPHSTLNRGKICARGQAGLRQTYDVDRLKTPLIRVEGSKRGEFRFRVASWEEAFRYIAERQQAAAIKPWEWTMVGGWTSCVFYMNWSVPFAMANEVPNIIASPMQHCVTTGHLGTDAVTGNFNVHDEVLPDYDNARYILLISSNGSTGSVSTCRMVRFAQGRKNGAKVVVLDPRCSETAAKADEWLKIRPGTDLAFLLAMLKIMLEEGLYDADFLRAHTNMPFLLYRDDDGQWQPLTDDDGRPLVMEEHSGELRTLPAFANDNRVAADGAGVHPALSVPAGFTARGRPVKTVLQAQIGELAGYTPEWASVSTGIDAATITRIAREFGRSRPAIVNPGWHGARYGNVMMQRRVQAMIQALNGGINKEGGWIMSGEVHHKAAHMFEAMKEGYEPGAPLARLAGMPFAKMVIGAVSKPENFSHGHPGWTWAFNRQEREAGRFNVALPVLTDTGVRESVEGRVLWEEKPYLTRAFFINAANPVRHYYPDSYWKEVLGHDNVELVVAIDVLPSDTVAYADVVLPNSTYLERDEPTLYGNGVNHDLALTTRYAAIPSLYDTEETADLLVKMTEIISGNVDGFIDWVEKLTGLEAAAVRAAWEKTRATHPRGAFAAACRQVSFAQEARRLGISVEELDRELREKGVYFEADRQEVLEKYGMPRRMPVPTDSGRIEFFSNLFHGLRQAGYDSPHFNPLAGFIPARCRKDRPMHAPLEKDEFYFTYGKTPTVSHASTNSNNPVLAAINRFKSDIYKRVWIHPDRAGVLGIRDGDGIRLTNTLSGQQATGQAHVTRLVRPDVLFVYSSFGVENPALHLTEGDGTATNKLVPHQEEPVVGGFRSQEFTIRVARA
ncbi:MAG TPA: molybdopterin oxidoreductase [Sedimenticola thiotaurini]|uniref:Molybdopterin oxidoreductase n=1 Tax=Sedimenticola thiotaurini TaxID=1543721 RepID=A0A831RLJ5_9GAMM|nr:molybdopterin oxidoreductase [Sedimenticola thiotaurini]